MLLLYPGWEIQQENKNKNKQNRNRKLTTRINPTSRSGFLSSFACFCLVFRVFRKLSHTVYVRERHDPHRIQRAYSRINGTTHLLAIFLNKINTFQSFRCSKKKCIKSLTFQRWSCFPLYLIFKMNIFCVFIYFFIKMMLFDY